MLYKCRIYTPNQIKWIEIFLVQIVISPVYQFSSMRVNCDFTGLSIFKHASAYTHVAKQAVVFQGTHNTLQSCKNREAFDIYVKKQVNN